VRTLPADFGWRLAIRFAFQAAVREPTEAGSRVECVRRSERPYGVSVQPGVSYGGMVRASAESFRVLAMRNWVYPTKARV
jgi:hypothetical protein